MNSATQVSRGQDVVAAMRSLQQRRRQLDPARRRAKQHAWPLPRPSTSLLQHARCYHPSKGDRQGTPCPTKPDGQATAVCSQASCTAMARPTRVKTRTFAWQVEVWWRTRAPGSPSRSPERCRSSSKMSREQSSSGCSCSCALRARLLSTSRTAALLSKALTSVGARPGRPAHHLGRTCGSTSGARSMPGETWATPFSVRKMKAHTTLIAVLAGVITTDDRAGNDLADAACKLVVLGTPCPQTSGRRGFRPTWPSHAWLTGLRALVLRGSDLTLTRLGSLGVGGRLREDASSS